MKMKKSKVIAKILGEKLINIRNQGELIRFTITSIEYERGQCLQVLAYMVEQVFSDYPG